MIVLRKRLLFWLIKAYFKRWGRNILIYFGIGLVIFFLLNKTLSYFIARLPFMEKESIGIIGAYSIDSLPQEILGKISKGLTKTEIGGAVKPDIAERWKIAPSGKAYAFYLLKNIYFSDGTNLTSSDINYDFADVSVTRPDKYTIVFSLKDNYSPFLATVSKPVFKKGYVGVGDYKIKKIELNGNFIKSIELYSEKYHKILTYQLFYPTVSALKTAFALGEVSKITNLPDLSYGNQGGYDIYQQDLEHAKLLIDKSETGTGIGKISLTIDTLAKYESVANFIANIWKKLNIETKIQVINQIPSSFQIFLGEFSVSSDPDQYVLWHSSQINNITRYNSARVDKLLEDGRKELDVRKRISIYTDFQKYLLSDPPASFLFFPYYYEVSKK